MPRFREPSELARAVSGEMSAWTPSVSADTTVRQTPLTERLSPGASSGARVVVKRSRNPAWVGFTSTTSPIASIRPVNITFD